jgi:predicted transcriptional regulator
MESMIDDKEKKHSIKCCYKLGDTDVDCLFKLMDIKKPVTSIELADLMKFSKTTVENSLKKLIDVGLVIRIKTEEKRIGRPKFEYTVPDNLWDKIRKDLIECGRKISSAAS